MNEKPKTKTTKKVVKEIVEPIEEIVPEVKMVKVYISHPFRYAKEWKDNTTKTLPEGVAKWMERKNYGKIL